MTLPTAVRLGVINSAEAQTGFDTVEIGRTPGLFIRGDIAFEQGLLPGAQLRQRGLRQARALDPELVETGVEAIDELLLVLQFNGIPG
ncbi:hypothetical protein ACFQVC_38430 [Streptomyces monticola]|uniref:Uncharacterized protein n=1 Tax=Streptomyces monticola TaxID=2666263 RepID=A0ABW2JVU5_9ACTN